MSGRSKRIMSRQASVKSASKETDRESPGETADTISQAGSVAESVATRSPIPSERIEEVEEDAPARFIDGPMTLQQREEANTRVLLEKCTYRDYRYDDHFLRPGLEFYKWICSQPDALATSNTHKLHMNIPDTVIYGYNKNPVWLFTGPDSYVHRIDSFPETSVLKKLRKSITSDDDLVAVMKRPDGTAFSKSNKVVILKYGELKGILNPSANMGKVQIAIQHFIRCKGPKPFIVRVEWNKSRVPLAWSITNKQTSGVAQQMADKDYSVDIDNIGSISIVKMHGKSVEYLHGLCSKLVSHLEKTIKPSVSFQEIIVDFLKGSDDRWWLLQVKAFRLNPSSFDSYRAYLHMQQGLEPNILYNPDYETPNGMLKIDVPTTSPPTYKKLSQCSSCCARYPPSEVENTVYSRMLLDVVGHLRKRGKVLPWFDFVEMSLNHKGAIDSYSSLKVCIGCYNIYQLEQKLMDAEKSFAEELKLQRKIPIDHQIEHHNQDYGHGLPSDLKGYRFLIYLHELNGVPDLQSIFNCEEFHISYSLFGRKVRVPFPCTPRKKLILDHSVIIPLFISDMADGIRGVFKRLKLFNLSIVAAKRNQSFITIPIQLNQFANPSINQTEIKPILLVKGDSVFFSIRISLAISSVRCCDPDLISDMKVFSGAFVPPVGFYTCDPLPDEWLPLITEQRTESDSESSSLRNSQLPGTNALLSPSTRFAMPKMFEKFNQIYSRRRIEMKDQSKSVWRFDIHVESLHRLDVTVAQASWSLVTEVFGYEFESEVIHGTGDILSFTPDKISLFFRGNGYILRKWLESQKPISFELVKHNYIIATCEVPVYDVFGQTSISGVFPMDLPESDDPEQTKVSKFSRIHKVNMPLLSISVELNPIPVTFSAQPPQSHNGSMSTSSAPVPVGMKLDSVVCDGLEILLADSDMWR